MRPGRKAKPNVPRFACGKVRPDEPENVMATALFPRLRAGVHYDDAVVRNERGKVVGSNSLAGYALGRLLLLGEQDPGGISSAQYHAGWEYANIVRRHASIMGYSLGSPKSPGFELVSTGLAVTPEPEEEFVLKTRRQFSDCYRALMDAGKEVNAGTRVATTTYDVCLDRIEFAILQFDDGLRGNLKIGLNALARVLR